MKISKTFFKISKCFTMLALGYQFVESNKVWADSLKEDKSYSVESQIEENKRSSSYIEIDKNIKENSQKIGMYVLIYLSILTVVFYLLMRESQKK